MNVSSSICRIVFLCFAVVAEAQDSNPRSSISTRPIDQLRQADSGPVLLTGGMVITEPGHSPRRLDVLVRGGTIIDVAADVVPPPGTRHHDITGKFVYAGFIDSMREVVFDDEPKSDDTDSAAKYWNANISPQLRAASVAGRQHGDESEMRGQGITSVLLTPKNGIVKGTSCLVNLVDAGNPRRLVRGEVFAHATLTVPRGASRDRYPNSPMGATALLRQSFYDALWYRQATRAGKNQLASVGPEPDEVLERLASLINSKSIVFDAANERMALRAADVGTEFSLSMILRGSGREYRSVNEIAATGLPILLPINFPKKPSAATIEDIDSTPLVDWMHWHFAPTNPRQLDQAGIRFAFTTSGLSDLDSFLKNIRLAVKRGLAPEVALASLTTTPAELMNVEDLIGRVKIGMAANLVVTDGELFSDEAKVFETWVAGKSYAVASNKPTSEIKQLGTWAIKLPSAKQSIPATIKLTSKNGKLSGSLERTDSKAGDGSDEAKPSKLPLKDIVVVGSDLSATIRLEKLGDEFSEGVSQLSWLIVRDPKKTESNIVVIRTPDGVDHSLQPQKTDPDGGGEAEKEDVEKAAVENPDDEDDAPEISDDEIVMTYPLGAYGRSSGEGNDQSETATVFRNATLWTCADSGVLEGCDVLVRDGLIDEIGIGIAVDGDVLVVDATGKHITPGLIDCHSHIATDGGVNESGQAVTSEVRIGDFIDNTDIAIYRQLAGGVTSANILHGSANPIGGQSQTVKFRWGKSMRQMKFADAPPGIKFALGENVKRRTSRYPNTRMGVEQLLRDQFLSARQYDAKLSSGASDGLPVRRDLQLDALVEVQKGKRWIHCHSYRQDEIVATLDVLEEFNVRIGTLQHILEGYKVADRIASHGAMASSFADWWAYKFEVYDAIPYNGVLMHDAGVVVSFNSDDAELGRHLNTEAAKASKYGGVPEIEALKFVTLNPAKQLRIDDRVGSIEVGKDADLVLWSGRPLSTTTRCEQTWIDGERYFSLDEDRAMRERDAKLKTMLVRKSLQQDVESKSKPDPADGSKEAIGDEAVPEDERWKRYDEFCNARGNGRDQ